MAYAFLAAPTWDRPSLTEAGRDTVGRPYRWIAPIIRTVLAAYRSAPADQPRALARLIATVEPFQRGLHHAEMNAQPVRIRQLRFEPTEMASSRWPVPIVDDLAALARLLEVPPDQLDWLADLKGRQRRTPAGPYHLYRYRWVQRPHGVPRLLEAPTPLLRQTLRRLLHEVLVCVPAHPAAHGFVPGRSAITHARQHVGAEVVLSLDLRHFFTAITRGRAYGLFRSMGYPEPVSASLAGLVTNRVPHHVLAAMPAGGEGTARHRLRSWLRSPHLPQGAPTSPSLANLACYPLDARLAGYAAAAGAHYSRYADDLAFSGSAELGSRAGRLVTKVSVMAAEEGFLVHSGKTRVQPATGRQQVTGIVVNTRPNIARDEYDRLRAVLHEARTRGVEHANRDRHPDFRQHLSGRVGWVESVNSARGRRLRLQLAAIAWPEG